MPLVLLLVCANHLFVVAMRTHRGRGDTDKLSLVDIASAAARFWC